MRMGRPVRRVLIAVAGGLLTVIGVILLVLPGPGLLLVLAGLLVLAAEFPAVQRYVAPVRERAMRTAQESVASPWRIAATATGGALLIAAGVVWGTQDWLPFSSWSAGSSLILSGLIVFALLIWSYRTLRTPAES
ncbi:MAG TPA: PGPGW domain-containing protein [Pseudonocardiaceae bacterium]|nr:PGPGW domain-containing protein [Pseudonocardiaceae bacterium]